MMTSIPLSSSGDTVPRLLMELIAVVCIETSHYVTFAKCGLGPDAPWCFFDSMADRKGKHIFVVKNEDMFLNLSPTISGEMHGYNIPEVTMAPDVPHWFSDEGKTFLTSCQDDKMLPEQAKRFICDGYMCFYQSTEVMMYR